MLLQSPLQNLFLKMSAPIFLAGSKIWTNFFHYQIICMGMLSNTLFKNYYLSLFISDISISVTLFKNVI